MSDPIPPGLPPGAQRIDEPYRLDRDLNLSKHLIVPLAMSLYDASQVVNGLAILESAMFAQGSPQVALEARALQQRLVKDLHFTARVREQMDANRKFLGLPPL